MTVWTKQSDLSTIWTKQSKPSIVWTTQSGTNVYVPYSWTTANRPTSAVDGFTGYNLDFKGIETYIFSSAKWRIFSGIWNVDTRPDTSAIDIGSQGYNLELGQLELWDGTNWTVL